jgi:hypothetical protein
VSNRGDQVWTGRNGIRRTVSADGTVALERPDGTRTIYRPDGAVRHLFPGRIGTSIAEVIEHQNGDVEWIWSDQTVGRHHAHGMLSENLDRQRAPMFLDRGRPSRWRSHVAVNSRGDLAFLTLEPRALRVRHADGSVTEFAHAGNRGWLDPRTDEAFADSRAELQQRLMALGASVPGLSSRHQDLTRLEGVHHYRLTLGLFELEPAILRAERAQRPKVTFVTRKKWDRPIASVVISPEGKAQVTRAAP